MDASKIEPSRSLGISKASNAVGEIVRPPLGLSEKNNSPAATRKSKPREIPSRYKSGITSASSFLSTSAASSRCPSPASTRTSTVSGQLPKRSQSAERRRPATPLKCSASQSPSSRPSTPSSPSSRSSTPVRDSIVSSTLSSRKFLGLRSADGLWPSMRSLSTSFQSESVSVPSSKQDKGWKNADPKSKSPTSSLPERKRTPLRGRNASDHSENSKPAENCFSRAADQQRWPGTLGSKLSAASMSRSMDLTSSMLSSTRGVSPRRVVPVNDGPGKLLQKSTMDGTRRMSLDGSGKLDCDKVSSFSSSNTPERTLLPPSRPARTLSMPIPSVIRPSSPSKASMHSVSSSRASASPSRTRPSSPLSSSFNGKTGIASSVLSYICDVRKGKKNTSHLEDAHQLRLLHNRCLQWRFVNARAETALSIQKMTTENMLYNVGATISELHDSVVDKKTNIQRLKQEMQLEVILKEQMLYLEDWASLEREHSGSLSGAIEALKASTIRLPVTGGARADFHALKDVISSAVDVMRVMSSSICYSLSRVERTNSLVVELAEVANKERAMLHECRELLALTSALQVQESSLRTHLLQLRQDMGNVG